MPADDLEAILAFERQWLNRDRTRGGYDRAVRERFGVSATTHTLRLHALLDDPRAVAADPVTVRVLRERRRRASKQRSVRLG